MSNPTAVRPVPAWVRGWAIMTFIVTLLLLFVLGGFVTSFRVGMADQVWPTEPWYLLGKDWQQLEFGLAVEHTHRAAGWIVGGLVIVLALGAWLSEPSRALRWFGLTAIVVVVACYGEFHRGMRLAYDARANQVPWEEVHLPVTAGVATAVAALLCIAACTLGVTQGQFGRGARTAAILTLIAVMIQGLLGGFRVFLDQLFGTALAAYHGVFGQVVLALMAVTVTAMAPRREGDALSKVERGHLSGLAVTLPVAVFVQLIWAVWVRHMGSPVAQRLHILTAFVVTGLAIWLSVRVLSISSGRQQLGFLVYHLLAILAVQVLLGVEAYMSKFAAAGPDALVMPMDRTPRVPDAAIRTAHAVVGAALFAASVVLALRICRWPVQVPTGMESGVSDRTGGRVAVM